MSPKTDNLAQWLQGVQKFVSERVSQDDAYTILKEDLQELEESLKTGQPKLHIISQDLVLAQALQKLLGLSEELRNVYWLKAAPLPKIPDPNAPPPPPALALQSPSNAEQIVRYDLTGNQTLVVGRNPSVAQLLLPDHLDLTSGSHAEFRSVEGRWQVRDSGSRNGTFINSNSQKLQDWYTLKAGDQICLGSASQASGSATLVFEIPSIEGIHSAHEDAQRLLNCNVLCLVIPPQSLSETTQRFIQLAQDSHVAKLFIIVDRPGGITVDAFRETLTGIENSIKNQLQNSCVELISLLLKPFIPSSGATVLAPHSQAEFEQFCKNLNSLSNDREEILAKWAHTKLHLIINQLEMSLVQKEVALKEKLQKDEERFKELSQSNLKKQIEKVYKKVDGERDSFFRQVKTELSQSKSNLLDEFRQSSLPYKIQQFTKQLQPEVSDQGDYRYVRLKVRISDTAMSDVHAAATELCHTELTRWATAEWSRIRDEYVGGGLDTFFKKSYDSLNFISELILPEDGFSTSQTLSIQSVLNVSNVEPMVELRYKKVGIWGYISKTVRTNLMSILGMVTLLGGAVAAVAAMVGFVFKPDRAIFTLPLLPILVIVAILGHKQEQEAKIEEASEKLQKEIISYYQSYTKGLVDRLIQRIGGLLEAEERRYRETLENVKETYASHISELDKTQSQLKLQLDEMKRSGQSKTEKDLAELRKLKQSL